MRMKSQRRHELQTNYLADHLGTAVQTGKPYAMWVTIGLVAAIVLALGYGIYASQAAKANARAWGDYYFNIGAGDAEVFQQVAEDHPGTAASQWAMQAWADNQLLLGLEQLYTNRKQGESSIQSAIEAYEGILKSSYEIELKSRAAMGLAQAYESLGKLDEATRYYQQVASSSLDGFARLATQRIAWIKSGEGKSFYDWFASVRSNPAPPPALPSDLSRPPQMPDMTFPDKQNPLTLPGAVAPPASETPSGSIPPMTLPGAPPAATPEKTTSGAASDDSPPKENDSGVKVEPAAPADSAPPASAPSAETPAPPTEPASPTEAATSTPNAAGSDKSDANSTPPEPPKN